MKLNAITELQLQLIINNNLYKKNIIDENTFSSSIKVITICSKGGGRL